MKRLFKSYFAFTSVSYRILWMLLIPVILYGFALMAVSVEGGVRYALRIVPISYLVTAEILSDYFFVGDICADGGKHMVCLQTSVRGSNVLKCVLWGDLLRRLFYCVAYGVVCLTVYDDFFGIIEGLLIYIWTVLATNVTRYVSGFMQTMAIGMVAAGVFAAGYGLCVVLFTFGGQQNRILLGVLGLLVLASGVSVGTIKHVESRVRGRE